jgi:dihydrodipicolinate synthase/N-acetylneuraminate lyase
MRSAKTTPATTPEPLPKEPQTKLEEAGLKGKELIGTDKQEKLASLFARTNIVPIVTPFTDIPSDEQRRSINASPFTQHPLFTWLSVDTNPNNLNKYLDHLISLKVTHIFVLGETGEFRFLNNAQRTEFAKVLAPLATSKGLKVFLNATAENYSLTKQNIAQFDQIDGVDAVVACPMWNDNEALFADLSSGVITLEKPLVIYNNPHITGGKNVGREHLQLARGFIHALKDSSGDPILVREFQKAANDFNFQFYLGSEALTAQLLNAPDEIGLAPMRGIVGASGSLHAGYIEMFNDPGSLRDIKQTRFTDEMLRISGGYKAISAAIKHALKNTGILTLDSVASGCNILDADSTYAVDMLYPKT